MHAEVLWLCRQLWLCSDPHKPIIWLKWIYKFLKTSWRSQNSRMQNEEFPHPGNPTSATSHQTHLNWLIARLDTKCTSFFSTNSSASMQICRAVRRIHRGPDEAEYMQRSAFITPLARGGKIYLGLCVLWLRRRLARSRSWNTIWKTTSR